MLNFYKKGLLIHTQLVLLSPSEEIASELQAFSAKDRESAAHFIHDLGLVMETIASPQAEAMLLERYSNFCQWKFTGSKRDEYISLL